MTMTPTIPDETLFAYVDDELDDTTRAQVDAAIAADPALARRVEQQRALRHSLGAAYDPVLDEPIPARLQAAARAHVAVTAKVVDLTVARRRRRSAKHGAGWGGAPWSWPQWGGMAACLLVGLLLGRGGLPGDEFTTQGGQLVARGALAGALSTQLASAQAADAPVKIGVSYRSRDQAYCRSFMLARDHAAGLACRQGDDWRLRVLTQDSDTPGAAGGLRMASSSMPSAVLRAIDEQIEGSALDAQAERSAMQKGWRP
jgi:hypothetical protein